MALHGKFLLNDADYAPFNLFGVGVFMAFSGRGNYKNNAACRAIAKDGPLPSGKYWIVDRHEGNWFSQGKLEIKDSINRKLGLQEFGKSRWFALYKDDWGIDDGTWIEGVHRGLFRLHPGRVSKGCITIAHETDFAQIYNALMATTLIQVPCMKSLLARGWIEVVANGYKNICPSYR